jgi:hypothetical protein
LLEQLQQVSFLHLHTCLYIICTFILIYHNVFKVHSYCSWYQNCLSLKAKYYSIVHMYFILLIYSSIYIHLTWFYVLAIVNNYSMNIGIQIPLWDFGFCSLGPYPELLDHVLILFLIWKKNILFIDVFYVF